MNIYKCKGTLSKYLLPVGRIWETSNSRLTGVGPEKGERRENQSEQEVIEINVLPAGIKQH